MYSKSEHKNDMKYGAPMPDPETGIHVPIMAVTMHPQTGAILPIGCTHVDPNWAKIASENVRVSEKNKFNSLSFTIN
jgi:hypothetical protein